MRALFLLRTTRVSPWALAAALAGCLGDVKYTREIPFGCGGNGACPMGYVCSANYCVRPGADLPTLLDQSAAPFAPQIHGDRDRDGAVVCWTRAEDRSAEHGGVYAAFVGADGQVHGRTTLYETDTRGEDFLATCAPIPGTDGKILVAVWLQRQSVARMRLVVWSPTTPRGFVGTSATFYEETSPDPSDLLPGEFAAAVVGDQAWVPYEQKPLLGAVMRFATEVRWLSLRVGAAELAAGRPARVLLSPVAVRTESYDAVMLADPTGQGAWLSSGSFPRNFAYVPDALAAGQAVTFGVTNPNADRGFGAMLAAHTVTRNDVPTEEFMGLWPDPTEPRVIGAFYSLATVARNRIRPTQGPRLPFSRLETAAPGAMRVGEDLYLFGAPYGLPPRTEEMAADAGAGIDAGTDAGAADVVLQASEAGVAATTSAVLQMYRIGWRPTATDAFETVRAIPRPLGDTPVSAAAAWPLPDARRFGLAWVTINAPDEVGHGVRYVLYLKHFSFP